MTPEQEIYNECRRNHGPIRVKRCKEIGASRHQIAHLVRAGRMKRIDRGILAPRSARRDWLFKVSLGIQIAGAPDDAERIASAACGPTAAMLHGLLGTREDRPMHILSTRWITARAGYVFHETGRLPNDEITLRAGLPVTDPIRTFLDVCAIAPPLAPWILEQGVRKGLMSESDILERCNAESRQGRRGLVLARSLCEDLDGFVTRTRSSRESEVLSWIKEAGFSLPERNVFVPSSYGHLWELDLLYRERKVVVEVSPSVTHGAEVFEKDLRKVTDLQSRGFTVIFVTDSTRREEFILRLGLAIGEEPFSP